MAASGFYVLRAIPICAPPPPVGLVVPECELRGLAYVIAPLGVMIALIGLGIFAVAQISHFNHKSNGLMEGARLCPPLHGAERKVECELFSLEWTLSYLSY